ncbi:hypothetical protein [Flavobacterium sp. UBA4197]|uniref:hypothetical protein n=1 Tax=Flavobacterium sp. UBA4197 TaxID=1946546 RepID=UPI00257FFC68|nr:hypothetical protein [Flavobacterium sp. UBA4197]
MNNFQYTFYRVTNNKTSNKFEDLFKEIKNQIEIYERQYSLTINSYIKEWNHEKAKIDANYKKIKDDADREYDEIVGDSTDDDTHQYAMHRSGVEAVHYNHIDATEEVEKEYMDFLDLYSKSIMIALYSLNESRLNSIATVAADLFLKKIKLGHFSKKDYLNSVLNYLDLVVEINIEALEPHISKLKDIQVFRNKVVHTLSVIPDKEASQIIKKKNSSLSYDKDTETVKIVSSSYIKDFFTLLKGFYEDLAWLIDEKQDYEILRNGFRHWLGILDRKLLIEDLVVTPSAKKKLITFKVVSPSDSFPDFNFKIGVSKAKVKAIDITPQIENEKINELITYENSVSGYNIFEVLKPFNFDDSPQKLTVLIYDSGTDQVDKK